MIFDFGDFVDMLVTVAEVAWAVKFVEADVRRRDDI